jgi:hypothetical protein
MRKAAYHRRVSREAAQVKDAEADSMLSDEERQVLAQNVAAR